MFTNQVKTLKNLLTCLCVLDWIGIFIVFRGEQKTAELSEKPPGAKERTNNNSSHTWHCNGHSNPSKLWWEAIALTTATTFSSWKKTFHFQLLFIKTSCHWVCVVRMCSLNLIRTKFVLKFPCLVRCVS